MPSLFTQLVVICVPICGGVRPADKFTPIPAVSQIQASEHSRRSLQGTARVSLLTYLLNTADETILSMYDESVATQARRHLEIGTERSDDSHGSEDGWVPEWHQEGNSVFADVTPAFPLLPPYVDHAPRAINVEGSKNIVSTGNLKSTDCIVYAAGIADNSEFEQQMAAGTPCQVHAFDCTIDKSAPAVKGKDFHFHDWCIGKGDGKMFGRSNGYVNAGVGINAETNIQFKSLESTMTELGHSHVDLLKFDIEGFEWPLFQDEILQSGRLPTQLAFELHTSGANAAAVPPVNVHDKHKKEVDGLFLKLYDKGFRVVSKEINPGDASCAEFVAINLNAIQTASP